MLRLTKTAHSGVYVAADMTALPIRNTRGCAVDRIGGIWACACLLHLDRDSFARTLAALAVLLRPQGCLSFSLKAGDGEGWDTHHGEEFPRWFTYWDEAGVAAALDAARLEIISCSSDAGRTTRWLRFLARATSL